MVRSGSRRLAVGVVVGTRRIGDRAVSVAGGVLMVGREFPPTGSGVRAAEPLIIPSQIGEAPPAAGVIRSCSKGRSARSIGRSTGRKITFLRPGSVCGSPRQPFEAFSKLQYGLLSPWIGQLPSYLPRLLGAVSPFQGFI
jgi:hypothetical protein